MKFLARRYSENWQAVDAAEVVYSTNSPEALLQWAGDQGLTAVGSRPNSGARIIYLIEPGSFQTIYVVAEPPQQKYLVRLNGDSHVVYVAECLGHVLSQMQGRQNSPSDYTVEMVPWAGR